MVTSANQCDWEKVEAWLDAGADPNTPGEIGRTALMFAAMKDQSDIADELLHKGAQVNRGDQFGRTALMWAAIFGSAEVADLLFTDHPADTVDDITLSTSVGANNASYTFIEMKYGFIGKTLEPFDF